MEWVKTSIQLPKTNDLIVIWVDKDWDRGYYQDGQWFDPWGRPIDGVTHWLKMTAPGVQGGTPMKFRYY